MNQAYEGKAKIVYEGAPGEVIIHFKDDATAGNGAKKASITGKGVLNCRITTLLFDYLAQHGIQTHFLEQLNERDLRCVKTKVIPLEVIVRNLAAGSMVRRLGMQRGTVFNEPIVEFSYKQDALGDPLVNDDHACALQIATRDELSRIRQTALQINELLINRFVKVGITLVDFKLEFGRTPDGNILLIDEISPDTCRFWDTEQTSFDKDRFREDSGDLIAGYQTILDLLKERA
jgi:phosphoribosylaminoimidazole-succinocarboxamide synthase